MKAAVYREYGGPEVIHLEEVPRPVPDENEVLIRIRATTVASGDWRMRAAEVPGGFRLIAPFIFGKKPRRNILGTELSGVVEAIGAKVTRWKVGDPVFAFPGTKMGAHAQYICMPEDGRIARKPENLTFAEAAAMCFGGSTALSFIEKSGGIHPGDEVLVVGASGSVGSAMVQLARHFGARVTGVSSGANADFVRSLGADAVIDYTKTDFATRDERYDVIMDTTGTVPIARSKGALKRGGRILVVSGGLGDMLRAPFTFGARVVAGPASEDPAHLPLLAKLAEAGEYKPAIDATYPFEKIVEAHRRVDSGHKRGNVVVLVD